MDALTVTVLADDLTGATDTVVQFRDAGWPAYLLLSGLPPAEVLDRADGLAVSRSLDTRALPHERAERATREAVLQQLGAGADRIYLKIDSTMRGSVGGQVRGALQAWSRHHAGAIVVLCPAYPPMGRVVRDGHVYVNEVPLHHSPAGRDPVTPVHTSAMTDLVPGAVHVGAGGDAPALANRLRRAAPDGGIVVVDAADEQDLRRLAEAAELLDESAVWAGSAGLARHLARVWHPGASVAAPSEVAFVGPGRVVVCISSLNTVSLEQARHLAAAFGADLARHELAVAELPHAPGVQGGPESVTALRDARVVLLQPDPRRAEHADRTEAARSVALGLATVVARILEDGDVAGLVLVGGDGAEATLQLLGAQALEMRGQLSEGVPLARIVGGSADGLTVVTKAGGFGTTTTMTDAVSAMLGHKEGPT
jgi:uncharacterized protein YgbK (DUF1537 family)